MKRAKKAIVTLLALLLVLTGLALAPAGHAAQEGGMRVKYIDPSDDQEKTQDGVQPVALDLRNGWYAVTENTSFSSGMGVMGDDVNLILCDGATLSANDGIYVTEGSKLTIWGQSDVSGIVVARASSRYKAGIGGINEENLDRLQGLGLDGIAVVSAIFAQDNVKEAAASLKEKTAAVMAG